MEAGEYQLRYERTLRLESALSELTSLTGVATMGAVTERREIDEALRKLVERSADVMEVSVTGVWRYDEALAQITSVVSLERAIGRWSPSGQVVTAAEAPDYFHALLSGDAVPAQDAFTDPRTAQLATYLERSGIGALLDAVMPIRGRFGGVVCFEHQNARSWSPEEIRFAIGVAGIAGVLVDRGEMANKGERSASPGLRFSQLYDDVPLGVATFDVDGTIRRANRKFVELFSPGRAALGRTLGEILGASAPDLVDLRARLVTGPLQIRRVVGTRTFEFTFTVVADPAGLPAFFAVIAIDDTIATGTRATLRAIREGPAAATLDELTQRLAAIVHADGILVGRLIGSSIRAEPIRIDGKEHSPITFGLVGTPCENVVRAGICHYGIGALYRFPDDPILVEGGFDSFLGIPLCGRGGETLGILAVYGRSRLAPDLPLEDLVGAFAKLIEAELQRQDYETDAEHNRQFLRQIADNIDEVFWILRWPDRSILYVTPSVEDLTGRAIADLMSPGRRIGDLLLPSEVRELDKIMAEGGERFEFVHHVVRPDGGVRFVRTRGFFLHDTEGKRIKLAGVSQDITHEHEAIEALRASEQRMADLFKRGEQEVVRLEHQLREGSRLGGLLGSSPAMRDVFRRIRQAADSDVTVLITGESGTGKELAAAAIHSLGARRGKPFIAINCAAIPESLLESELFGYVRGAFTGASRDKIGLMQAATGGTLFLDEIGDMTPGLQVKLLRAIQERSIRRLGGDAPVAIDIRLLSATHRDMRELVASGQMREDFFYRIDVFEIEMPALRAHADDIPLLASYFATELNRLAGRPPVVITREAMTQLVAYPWPGNVRELRNAIEHALVSVERGAIQVSDLPLPLREARPAPVVEDGEPVGAREVIEDALRHSGGNRTEAARALGISRVTLWKRMRRLGLVPAPA